MMNFSPIFWCLAFMSFSFRTADAGYCYTQALRYSIGYRIEYYTTSCGWWSTCSRSRTVTYRAQSYYTVSQCCDGYTGGDCSSPICNTQCRNGGNCIAPDTCSCPGGYGLPYCDDINECYSNNGGCSHTCVNTIGSYRCMCPSGFSLSVYDRYVCQDDDECGVDNGGCTQVCHNTRGSHACSCHTGYLLASDGATCTDVDECRVNNGDCSDICNNVEGSYTCSCNSGFGLSVDGKTCTDIDECDVNNGGCQSLCSNTQGSYECSCEAGFHLDVNMHSCNDDDECIITYKGGCQDLCVNTRGSFHCACHNSSPLNTDGLTCEGSSSSVSVYQRYGIVRKLLPRGCSTLSILTCNDENDFQAELSSTSPWYQLKSDTRTTYTRGIVFVEMDSISLPISIDGLTVISNDQGQSITSGVPVFADSDGNQLVTQNRDDCLSVEFTAGDIAEFVDSLSLPNSFFDSLDKILPDWLSISLSNKDVFSYSNIESNLVIGETIDNIEWCRGAPVKASHSYHVLLFGEAVTLTVYGDSVSLPKPANGEKLCFIIDICQDRGSTFFLMFPEYLRTFLSDLKLFQTLTKNDDIELLVRGVGISVNRQINVHYHKKSIDFWNGDHVFQYPVFERANLWFGSNYSMKLGILEINGDANLFIGVPSIQNILIAAFKEEWNMLFDMSAVADMRFKFELFGKQCELLIGEVAGFDMESHASIGGLQEREFCGSDANPSGIFFSANLKANPFRNIPMLQDWFLDLNLGVQVFVVKEVDTALTTLDVDVTPVLSEVSGMVENIIKITSEFLTLQIEFLTQNTVKLIKELNQSLEQLSTDLQSLIDIHTIRTVDWSVVADAFQNAWSKSLTAVKGNLRRVLDSLEFNVKVFHANLTDSYQSHMVLIEESFEDYIERVASVYTDSLKQLDGFGIRAQADIMLFTLVIPKVTIEFIYSVDSLGKCSKYKGIYELLENEESARLFGMISTRVKLGKFVSMGKDYGVGAAFSISSPGRFIFQLHAGIQLLGVTATCDLFISNNGIYTIYEIKVWNTFLAQLTVSAEIGKAWYDLTYSVIGKFLADADGDGSFEDSYMDALRKVVNDIGNAANDRLTYAQSGLTKAQNAFTKAQSWLETQKEKLRNANRDFDNAITNLEGAKQKLEAAKEPFRKALERLNEAQRDVDRLCRIQTCRSLCVPGWRSKTCTCCWGVRFPCPTFTSCMFTIPDPICVAKNSACRLLRGAAYVALEAAKVFVRAPMVAMDVAKAGVSVAQFVVDKSRVVLDVAIGLVDVAQIGLEAAKGALEIAKAALEGVKVLVKVGLKVFDLIIRMGLQKVVDARNCQFEVHIKTTDLPVLSVECEINLFSLGWKKVKLEVNFRRILQSLWQVAKEFIESIIDSVVDIFGRKRREIEYMTKHFTYQVLREIRDADDGFEALDLKINETVSSSTTSSDDYSYRVLSFRDRCSQYNTVVAFFNESIGMLIEIINDTVSFQTQNGSSTQNDTIDTNDLTSNMTLDGLDFDLDVAREEYNITTADLDALMSNLSTEVADDSLILEISKLSNETKQITADQIEMSDNSNVIEIWIQAMENSTRQYYDNNTCASFIDCVHHSVSVLYDIFYGEDSVNTSTVYDIVSEIESMYLELLGNETTPVLNIDAASDQILEELSTLNEICPFCYIAPTLASPLSNLSVQHRENAYFMCDVTGDPEPELWWFLDDEYLEGEGNRMLTVRNVTKTMGPYRCVAGNVVANLTTPEVYVNVQVPRQDQDTSAKDLTIILVTTISVSAVLVVASILVLVRLHLRHRARKNKAFGSFATLNMIRPASAMSHGKPPHSTIITVKEVEKY